jgi:exonuclease VII small subunit
MKFEVTAIDELTGIVDRLEIVADSLEDAVYIVESDPLHEYEIFVVDRL